MNPKSIVSYMSVWCQKGDRIGIVLNIIFIQIFLDYTKGIVYNYVYEA